MDKLVERVEALESEWPDATPGAKEKWERFVNTCGLVGKSTCKKGVFFATVSRSEMEVALAMYVRWLIVVEQIPPSTIEKAYNGALIPNKKAGRQVQGCKEARKLCKDFGNTHVRTERTLIDNEEMLKLLREMTNFVFGPPGKRKRRSELDLEQVKAYFVIVAKASFGTREASLLQPAPKKGQTLKVNGAEYFVLDRDMVLSERDITIVAFTKQSRAKKSLKPETFTFPRPRGDYGTLAVIGPFWAGGILNDLMKSGDKRKYLTKKVYKTKSRPMHARDSNDWLKKLKKDSAGIARVLGTLDKDWKFNPSTLRSQFFCQIDKVASNPQEMLSLTKHSNMKTVLTHYLKVTRKRQREMKIDLTNIWNTAAKLLADRTREREWRGN